MRTRGAILLVAGLLLAACGGAGLFEQPVTSTFHDPQGDTLNLGGTQYDITQVRTERTSANLSVQVTFVQGIFLPGAGQAATSTQLSGALELDTDRNPSTGNASACPTSAGRQTIGVDRYVLLNRRNPNGTYDVVNASGVKTGEASASVSGSTSNVFVLSVDRSALGEVNTNLVVIAGNGQGGPVAFTPTDCAPDQGGAVVTRVRVALPGMR